jgi:hypothetical protein
MNYKTKKKYFLFLASFVLSLGLLTKFNFVMYAGPIALAYYGMLFYELKKGEGSVRGIFISMFQLASFPVLLSSPWYFYNIYSQGGFGALHAADYAYRIGILQKNDTLQSFVGGLVAYFKVCFPSISFVSLFIFIIAWALSKIRTFNQTTDGKNNFEKKTAYFGIPLLFIALVTAYVNYMGMPQRWNLSYAFLAIIFALFSESLPLKVRSLFLTFSGTLFFVMIFNSYIWGLVPELKTHYLLPPPLPALLPASLPTGSKEAFDLVLNDSKKRYVDKVDAVVFGIVGPLGYLDPRMMDYYAEEKNFNESWIIPSPWTNPAGAEIFFVSDYLIYTPENLASDSVNIRYKYILDHLPETYAACLSRVAALESKAGQIFVDNLNKNCLTSQAVFDLIEVGRKYDENTPFEIFWALDAENAKLDWEGKLNPFSEYQQDYYDLSNQIEQEKEQLPPHYYLELTDRLGQFYKNVYRVLDWGNWSRNLLLNSSFETAEKGKITDWFGAASQRIKIINDVSKSHSGNGAIKVVGQESVLMQRVAANPEKIYLLKQYTRSNIPAQVASLQVLWLDQDSQFIRADIVQYEPTSTWVEQKMILFPPSNGRYADVYITVVGESAVWFDDVTLQESVENGSQ